MRLTTSNYITFWYDFVWDVFPAGYSIDKVCESIVCTDNVAEIYKKWYLVNSMAYGDHRRRLSVRSMFFIIEIGIVINAKIRPSA
jgi:hypothetical protein